MSERRPDGFYKGFAIYHTRDGYVFRQAGGITHGAKTLAGAYGAIRKLCGREPKPGAPDDDGMSKTYRIGRDSTRRDMESQRIAEMDRKERDAK